MAKPGVTTEPVRPKERFLVFGQPDIRDDEIREVVSSMTSGWLGTGPKVARFERDFGAYVGASHAVALNSCTAALHLSLLALGLSPGDEVITTALTFCATANAILHAGAVPVLADVDPRTMNVDPDDVLRKITPRTKALLPVHFAGRACDMDRLMAIAERHRLVVIEDCAHAIETTWKGRHAGTFGAFGCFSFYATKNVATGEGGLVVTKRPEDAARVKVLGLHGMSQDAWKRFSDEGYKHYQVVACGFKYNMMDLQAAIGIHQLARVETAWERRKAIWARYDRELAGLPLRTPAPPEAGSRHAHHLYTVLVDEGASGVSRDAFLTRMTREGIGVGVHYQALPEHPYYQETLGWRPEATPNATAIGRRTVSLPLSPKLTDEDVQDVVTAVRRALLG
jgi:dTDP-4-amino-4,6-dideoxygalactose transaminase